MAVVGSAEVLVVPVFKGMHKKIDSGLVKPLNQMAKKRNPGKELGDRVVGGLGTALKVGAGAVIAGAAGVVGTALAKGFGRLKALEEARAKLDGLGHSTKTVEGIMDDALKAVKGTAFGMDEAATTAAGAVAAGIKPGKDLENVLRLTGDAATIAGVGMGEMGAIFNKVATSNKIQGDVINQLNDKGIPIIQLLSKELGKSAEETVKLASKGEINFETFRNAMEKGVGGAALKSGDTLQGAFKNTVAALGRIGASLLGPLYEAGRKFFNWAMNALGPVEDWAKDIAPVIGGVIDKVFKGVEGLFNLLVKGDFTSAMAEAFDISDDDDIVFWLMQFREGVIKAWEGLVKIGQWVVKNKDWLGSIAVAIGAGAAAFVTMSTAMSLWTKAVATAKAAQALFNAVLAANPIMLVISAVVALTAGLVWFFTKTETGQKVWQKLTGFFQTHVLPIFKAVGDFFVALWNEHLKPVFVGIGEVFKWVWENVLSPVIGFVKVAFGLWMKAVKLYWDTILHPVFRAIGAIFKWVWEKVLSPAFTAVKVGFHLLVKGVKAYWDVVLKPTFKAIGDFFKWVWNNVLKPAFTAVKIGFHLLVRGVKAYWDTVLKPTFKAVGDFFKGVWERVLKPAFTAVRTGWDGMSKGIASIWTDKLKPVFDAVGKFVKETVVQKVKDGVKAIQAAWKKVANFFREPINWVIQTVFNNGIVKGFNWVTDKLGMKDKRIGKIATIPAFAKGGHYKGGLALVGEEGPELINFGQSGWVSTAKQTEQIARSLGRDLTPEESRVTDGRREKDALLPAGGNWIADLGNKVAEFGKGAVDWAKDGLVKAVDALFLKPLRDLVTNSIPGGNFIGDMSRSMAGTLIDGLRDWVRGEEEASFDADGGPVFKGSHLGKFARPASGPVTSHFGSRWGGFHSGIDLAVPIGSAIRAAWDGIVQKASWNALVGRTGKGMVLSHAKGIQTYYGHLNGWVKKVGDKVKAGDIIARSGNTGRSTGPHLHFEEIRKGRPVNPAYLFRDRGGNLPPGLSMVLNRTGRDETILPVTPAEAEAAFLAGRGGASVHIENAYAMSTDQLARDIAARQRRAARLRPAMA